VYCQKKKKIEANALILTCILKVRYRQKPNLRRDCFGTQVRFSHNLSIRKEFRDKKEAKETQLHKGKITKGKQNTKNRTMFVMSQG
jgi:hypothetical protein